MGKLALAIATGLVGAVIVHIGVIFAMPYLAQSNAWGRLSALGPLYEIVGVSAQESADRGVAAPPAQAPGERTFTFVDPAFVTASCRFSLDDGLVRVTANGASAGFWSASIYDGLGDNLYSINDRSAIEGAFNLLVGNPDQIVDAMAERGSRFDPTLIPVELDLRRGYITVRVFVGDESKRPSAEAFVQSLSCEPVRPHLAGRATGRTG